MVDIEHCDCVDNIQQSASSLDVLTESANSDNIVYVGQCYLLMLLTQNHGQFAEDKSTSQMYVCIRAFIESQLIMQEYNMHI